MATKSRLSRTAALASSPQLVNTVHVPPDNDTKERLLAAAQPHKVTWDWTRGHAGDPLNERADKLARAAVKAQKATSA